MDSGERAEEIGLKKN